MGQQELVFLLDGVDALAVVMPATLIPFLSWKCLKILVPFQ
jgi:hypothetical protein